MYYNSKKFLEIAKKAALKGLRAASNSSSTIITAYGHDVTTKADIDGNLGVIGVLRKETPLIPILSEETKNGFIPDKGQTYWVVDPQDGSNNRSRGFPYWSVGVSLAVNGKVQVAVVATNFYCGFPTVFSAIKGMGMFRDLYPVVVSNRDSLVGATVAFDNSYTPEETAQVVQRLSVLTPMPWLKNFGSAVLTTAEVASGTWDAHYHWAFKPWDIAAALLFMSEAGGEIIDLETLKPATLKTTKAVCGNKKIVKLILEQVKPVK